MTTDPTENPKNEHDAELAAAIRLLRSKGFPVRRPGKYRPKTFNINEGLLAAFLKMIGSLPDWNQTDAINDAIELWIDVQKQRKP